MHTLHTGDADLELRFSEVFLITRGLEVYHSSLVEKN